MMSRRMTGRSAVAIRAILLALGVALLAWLLAGFDWHAVATRLTRPDPGPALLVVGASLAYLWVRSCRWFLLVGAQARRVGFWPLHASTALGIGLGNFAPLQAGEYLKVEWLARRTGVSRVELAGAFVVERILDVLGLGVLLVAGAGVFLGSGRIAPWVWAVLGGLTSGGIVLGLVLLRRKTGLVPRLLAPTRALAARPGLAVAVVGLTLLSWFLVIASWSALGRTFGIALGLGHALSLCASVTTLRIASCVPAGVGVDEAGVVGLMPVLGHAAEAAQVFALALRLLDLLLVLLALCFLKSLLGRKHSAAAAPDQARP